MVEILQMKVLHGDLHRTYNMHDALYNCRVIEKAAEMLSKIYLSFQELREVRVAFQLYEHEDMMGLVIGEHVLLRTLKVCGRTVSPVKLMQHIKHMKTDVQDRLLLYEFLDLLLLWERDTDIEVQATPQVFGKDNRSSLYKICDFNSILVPEDEKKKTQLNNAYEQALLKPHLKSKTQQQQSWRSHQPFLVDDKPRIELVSRHQQRSVELTDHLDHSHKKETINPGATMDRNHDQNNIEAEIRRNEERIAALEKDLKESLRSTKDLKDRINVLEEKIQKLKDENKLLKKQRQEMEKRMENLEKEIEHQKAVLVIVQIGTALQRNLCKYVLGEHFKENWFYKFKEICNYIQKDLKHDRKAQESARKRLTEVKKKIPWDQRLVDSLKTLNETRIGYAHPDLSSEIIQQATDYLKEKTDILDEGMVDNVNELKKQWKTSEELLNRAAGGSEDGPEGGTMNLSTAGQSQDTYASRAAGGPEDGPEGGTMNLSTAGQNQDTYASRAAGGLYFDTKG